MVTSRAVIPSVAQGSARSTPGIVSATAFLWILYCALFFVDFFLTSDPEGAALGSAEYAIGPQLLGGLVVVVGLVFTRATRVQPIVLLLSAILLISGLLSGGLASRGLSYLFDIGALQLCSSLAYRDAQSFPKAKWLGGLAARVLLSILLIGFVAALASPKYGGVYATLSRDARSLIALWYFLGLYSYGYAMIISGYIARRSSYWGFALVPFMVVALLSYKRTFVEVVFVSLLVGGLILYYCSSLKKDRVLGRWILGAAIISVPVLIQLLLLKGPGQTSHGEQSDVTNGRADLWAYYLTKFLQSPVYGNGAYFADKAKDYYGTATSEIGVLRWFTEFGAVYALLILAVSIYSLFCVYKVVRTQPRLVFQNPQFVFVAVMICSCFPIFITESVFTLQSPDGFLYWYGIFYAIWFWQRVKNLERHLSSA